MTIKNMCINCTKRICLEQQGLLCGKAEAYVDQDSVKALRETTMELEILEAQNRESEINKHRILLTAQEVASTIDVDVTGLSRIETTVLSLFEIQGLSYAEISRHLSGPGRRFSKKRVSNILYQARKKAKEAVKTVDA